MVKSKGRTFKTYKLITKSLTKDEIVQPGRVATVLLETFIYHGGQLKSDFIVEKKLCKMGKFSIWRDELIQKGWLCYAHGDYSKHSPGGKLIKYINKEKWLTTEISSVEEVDKKIAHSREDLATKEELEEVKERLSLMEEAVKGLIEQYDPPVTRDKVDKRLSLANKTTKKYQPKEPTLSDDLLPTNPEIIRH